MKISSILFIILIVIVELICLTLSEQCIEYIKPLYRRKTRIIDCPTVSLKDKRQTPQASIDKIAVDFHCLIYDKTLCDKVENVFITAGKFITATLDLKTTVSVKAQFLDFCTTYGECDQRTIILGAAGPARMIPYQGPKDDKMRFYPQALYKQMDLPAKHPEFEQNDIMAMFNSNMSYWFEGDPLPMIERQADLLYIVVHELIHGLGFIFTWNDYFGIQALTPAIGGVTKTKAPPTGTPGKSIDEFNSIQFYELISDKYLVLLPSGKSVTSIADEINKFQINLDTLPSSNDLVNAFIASPQFPIAQDMYKNATTRDAIGFLTTPNLPPNTQLTPDQILNDVIILETSLVPFQYSSSVGHVDFNTYLNTSDFLMLYKYPREATLGQMMFIAGSTDITGPIGPKLRLFLEILGYNVKKEYIPPVKLSNLQLQPSNTNNSSLISFNLILTLACILITFCL